MRAEQHHSAAGNSRPDSQDVALKPADHYSAAGAADPPAHRRTRATTTANPLFPPTLARSSQSTSATMGGQISKMMGKIFGSKEMRLLMLGLDAAGKTSTTSPLRPPPPVSLWSPWAILETVELMRLIWAAILYKLKLNQDVTTIPTVGFNVETVTYKNVKFNVWDVGGQDKIRPLWRHYFSGVFSLPCTL